MKQLSKRLTYANVMSSIAVFLVLGGATAFAAKKIGSNEIKGNSITTGKLKKEAVTKAKIKKAAVDSSKLADGAVTTAKLAGNSVVPDAAKLGGKTPSSYESKAFHSQGELVSISGTGTTTVSSLNLPAGTYAIFGRGSVNNNDATATSAAGANSVQCSLSAGTDSIEVRNMFLGANGDPGETEDISAHIVHTFTAPGTADLTCTTNAFSGNVITPETTAISVQP